MPPPWLQHTSKQLGRQHHRTMPAPAGVTPAAVPPSAARLTFTAAQLEASLAMTLALSNLPSVPKATLATSSAAMITAFVDDNGPSLAFTQDVTALADAHRTFVSGLLGAAVADLYMQALGYVFRCNTREEIASGAAGDFLYDGWPFAAGSVALTEAKGSIVAPRGSVRARHIAQQAYMRQVAPHLGQLTRTGLHVAHGYAVATGGVAGGAPAVYVVVETGGGSATPPPDGGSPRPRPAPSDPDRVPADPRMVLRNYRAVFQLLGAREQVLACDAALDGATLVGVDLDATQRTFLRNEPFVNFPAKHARDITPGASRYALWEPAYERLRELLGRGIATQRGATDAVDFPRIPSALREPLDDGLAVMSDGLAVVPFHEIRVEPLASVTPPPPTPKEQRAYEEAMRVLQQQRAQASTSNAPTQAAYRKS
jgi:hypothetical protein